MSVGFMYPSDNNEKILKCNKLINEYFNVLGALSNEDKKYMSNAEINFDKIKEVDITKQYEIASSENISIYFNYNKIILPTSKSSFAIIKLKKVAHVYGIDECRSYF